MRLGAATVLLAVAAVAAVAAAATNPRDGASWWIATFGVVDEGQNAQARRARQVFERVRSTADKKGKRLPSLLMVQARGKPLAMALPDGSVVLTEEALQVCYAGVPEATGDARVAFVLGHELAHLAHDHFWHAQAFQAVAAYSDRTEAAAALSQRLRSDPGQKQRGELEADADGLLFMTMAGYDPGVVVEGDGGFLAFWAAQLDEPGADSHPSPAERTALLRAEMRAVAAELEAFHFGLRLHQLGSLEDAVVLLEHFKTHYPGREVFNNLGLSHFQLAVRSLAACDASLLLRYRLPTSLDATTLAARLRTGDGSPCLAAPSFRTHIVRALRYLQRAAELDPTYVPARVNLVSAHLLAGEPAQAHVAAREGRAVDGSNLELAASEAVALNEFGRTHGFDTGDRAITMLEHLHETHPGSPLVACNLALVLEQRGRHARASAMWQEVMRLEPDGPWVALARERLHLAAPEAVEACSIRRPVTAPPVALGGLDAATRKRLAGLQQHRIVAGDFRCTILRDENLRVLQIGDSVELVEERLPDGPDRTTNEKRHGPPLRQVPTTRGTLLVYDGIAFDLVDGRAESRLFFSRR